MRDEEHGQSQPLAQLGQQIQNLRLHRHVQGRRRLIGNQQRGTVDDGHGDHDPLALASAELVRIVPRANFGLRDSHLAQSFDCARVGISAGDALVLRAGVG